MKFRLWERRWYSNPRFHAANRRPHTLNQISPASGVIPRAAAARQGADATIDSLAGRFCPRARPRRPPFTSRQRKLQNQLFCSTFTEIYDGRDDAAGGFASGFATICGVLVERLNGRDAEPMWTALTMPRKL